VWGLMDISAHSGECTASASRSPHLRSRKRSGTGWFESQPKLTSRQIPIVVLTRA